jgi:hypothetical protein
MTEPQVDPVSITQSGINPITGSPLSSEQRKALFKRAVAPSSILGKGGSLVKRTDDSSPLIVSQTQQITSLQDQLNVLRAEVSVLNTGLTSINNILQRDGILEQKRLKGEQEEERRNLEKGVRIGKENELERKIQSALMVPVVALQKKVTNIFDNIFGALSTLFMGWLTNQGIETLKALDEENRGKLEQIKDTVLKNIAYAIGGIAAIKIGFGLIIRSVVGLTARISAIAVRIALAPFRFLGGQLSKVPGALGGLFGGGGKKPPAPPKTKVPVTGDNLWTRATNFFKGAGAATKGATAGAAKTGGSLISKLFAPINIGISAYRFSQGDIPGGALSALSAMPIIGLPAVGVDIAREFGAFEGTFLGKNEKTKQSSIKQEPTPPVAPQKTMMSQPSELTLSSSQEPSSKQETAPPAAPQKTMMPQLSELILSPPSSSIAEESQFQLEAGKNMMQMNNNTKEAYTMPSLISSAEMQNIPTQSPNISNLPEPQANVVVLPAPQSQKRQSMIAPSSAGSDAPLINSANPDNFYVLYSQLNYNVVM